MKSSSLGPLIALSALAVAPSAALAQEPTTPATQSSATTPEPAPSMTAPAASSPDATPGSNPAPSDPGTSTSPATSPGTSPAPTTSGSSSNSTTPQAQDPGYDEAYESAHQESTRRRQRREAREAQAERDPAPTSAASNTDLIAPSTLSVQAVPNFFIEDFDIPPFLLPIYQAAGSEYGIRWEVLAAINRVETAFGRNLNISSAGALGWMQFMPATWAQYGVDANDDGEQDPFNPADAIFAAARYLKAAGGDTDLRKAIFAYNHADWYVDQVMEGARAVAAYPDSLIGSLTGLTQGIFPVDGADDDVDYPGKLKADKDGKTVKAGDNAADPVESEARDSIEITAAEGSRVVAVQDGVVEKVGRTERLGSYVRLRDSYGNRYTYAHLGEIQDEVPVPKPSKDHGKAHAEGETQTDEATATSPDAPTTDVAPATDAAPTDPATDSADPLAPAPSTATATPEGALQGTDPASGTTPAPQASPDPAAAETDRTRTGAKLKEEATSSPKADEPRRIRFRARTAVQADPNPQPARTDAERLYAHPTRPESYAAGGAEQLSPQVDDAGELKAPVGELAKYFSIDYGLKAEDVTLKKLKAGQAVIAGTVLGKTQLSLDGSGASKVTFEVRPAGKKAPRIDPRPILDGWRLSDKTDFYGAQAKKAIEDGADPENATVGQILLMGKSELIDRVLHDKRITIYEGGQNDIKAGLIDRRILALLEVLATKGVEPTVTSLKSGHGTYTSSGNVSQHTTGTAVDIATAYGKVISPATQGLGSITDRAVREILQLQGNMKPDQIITLMKYEGEPNTLAMGDHDDHIHVGYKPTLGADGKQLEQLLRPGQWDDLVNQLSTLEVPNVAATPSDYSVKVDPADKAK